MSNQRFADHVQAIAFHLTLSRSMIEALGLIRDFGAIHTNGAAPSPHLDSYSVPKARALERRGLVMHFSDDPRKKVREKWPDPPYVYKLTRAGELVCDLLVEAELLSEPRKHERAA